MSQKTEGPRRGLIGLILAILAGTILVVVILANTKISLPWVSAAPAAVPTSQAAPAVTVLPSATPERALVVATGSSSFVSDAPASKATKVPPSVETPTGASSVEGIAPANTAQTGSSWQVTWFDGGGFDRGDGTTFRSDLAKIEPLTLQPRLFPVFPNVDIDLGNGSVFLAANGVEYAMDESNFCQQLEGEAFRFPVAARHYFLFTGDYNVPGIGECSESGTGYGCMLIIVNVGEVTADLDGVLSQGFRLHGRYWNGETLGQAVWALASHTTNLMVNLDNSDLNPNNVTNAGANCSTPYGCKGTDVLLHYTSGNEPLVQFRTQWP